MNTLDEIKDEIRRNGVEEKIEAYQKFFKTGKGEYGHGDKFLGLNVPTQRRIAREYFSKVSLDEIKNLLKSSFHEERLTALLMLVFKFEKGNVEGKKKIVDFYLANIDRVNNWDLVDHTSSTILGTYLVNKKDRAILYKLAKSQNLWQQRVAVISTLAFIQQKDFDDILKLTKIFLTHKHDLMHKAVGWMLREVGKKDKSVLLGFLETYSKQMPRTMLRYAIERLDEGERRRYMQR